MWRYGPARARSFSLPTFQSFSLGTTVVVPDRGSVYLGGVDRAHYGDAEAGVPGLDRVPGAGRLFRDRSLEASVGRSGAYATATIVDHREWDEAVLSRTAQRRAVEPGADRRRAQSCLSHAAHRPPLTLNHASARGLPVGITVTADPRVPKASSRGFPGRR